MKLFPVRELVLATIRKAMTPKRRKAIWDAYEGRCAACDEPLPSGWIADHRLPLDLGGRDDLGNLQPLCPDPCNKAKCRYDAKRIAEMRRQQAMRLDVPVEPSKRPIRSRNEWPKSRGLSNPSKYRGVDGRVRERLP